MVHVKTLLERISTIALGMTMYSVLTKYVHCWLLWYLRCAKLCDATREQNIVHTSNIVVITSLKRYANIIYYMCII